MLSNQHFYHRTTRKMVVAFGNMFNNIRLIRYDKAGTTEIERITVPLAFASKEKFYKRIYADPELTKETDLTLPRMGFDLVSITYDPLRKTSIYNTQFSPGNSVSAAQSVIATPYNFEFELDIYVRNVEDGTQIIEQILPYFNPDYTVSADLVGLPEVNIDVPLILESISYNNDAEGPPDPTRVITWSLNFMMKGYLYGPTSEAKLITKATANTFYYNQSNTGTKTIKMQANGTNSFKVGEMVYEGRSYNSANATGYVDAWDATSRTLVLVDCAGVLNANSVLRGAVTGATWRIDSFGKTDYQLAYLSVTPNPNTANPANNDFGFSEVYIEAPYI